MPRTPRAHLLLLATTLACDAGDPRPDEAKADTKVEAKVEARVEAKAGTATAADLAATGTAAVVAVAAPPLKAIAEVEAALGKAIALKAADLELTALVDLVARGELGTAAELELLLNAPGGAAHRVDLDADGKLDYLQVVEVRSDAAIHFEIRAIPSLKADAALAVLVATLATVRAEAEGAVEVVASYGAAVTGGADVRVEKRLQANFAAGAVVLAEPSAFVAWSLDVARPVYVSTHVAAADIAVAADGSVHFVGDAGASLAAARLASLRGALVVDVQASADLAAGAAVGAAAGVAAGAKANADAAAAALAEQRARAEAAARAAAKAAADASARASAGVKAGGSVGVSVGGGVSFGGGAKAGAKAGGSGKSGIKIGR